MENIGLTIPERYALENPHICFQAINKEEGKSIYKASFVKYAEKIIYEGTTEEIPEEKEQKRFISEYDKFQDALETMKNAFPFDDNMKGILNKVKEEITSINTN